MSKSIYQQLIDHFGGQSATAEAIGVKQPTISGYLTGRWNMTAIVAMRAEAATGRKIKAEDLCPALKDIARS